MAFCTRDNMRSVSNRSQYLGPCGEQNLKVYSREQTVSEKTGTEGGPLLRKEWTLCLTSHAQSMETHNVDFLNCHNHLCTIDYSTAGSGVIVGFTFVLV